MMKAARGLDLAELPEEVIMEILLKLPASTLVSLKSVCTSWRDLISSPDFTRNHHRRSCLRDPSLTPPRIAFYDCSPYKFNKIGVVSVQSIIDNPSETTQVDYFKGYYHRIVGSCHGLLCLLQKDACQNMHVMLWNPCTGFTFESPEIIGEEVCFPGFGYDHLNDSYRFYAIVRKQRTSGFEYSTRIYTFGPTSSWRIIDDNPFDPLGFPDCYIIKAANREGEFFGNSRVCTINWSIYHMIFYFDLGKETYGHFPLPDMVLDEYSRRWCTHLCVLRNRLSVCYQHTIKQEWIGWQMKEYGDAQSWTKLAVIQLRLKFTYPNPYNCLQPFYISKNDVLLAFFPSFSIVLYNLNDGSVEIDASAGMGKHPFSCQCLEYRVACIYHDCLFSPNGLQSNSSKMLLRFAKPEPEPIDS